MSKIKYECIVSNNIIRKSSRDIDKIDFINACKFWGFSNQLALGYRESIIEFLNFNQEISYKKEFNDLDSSSKNSISFNIGMLFSIVLLNKWFKKIDVFDISILEKYNLITVNKNTKSRPDLVCIIPNSLIPFLIEAKCYKRRNKGLHTKWKGQINSINSNFIINGNTFSKIPGRVISFYYNKIFSCDIIDPDYDIEFNVPITKLSSMYYKNIYNELNNYNLLEEKNINNIDYFGIIINDVFYGIKKIKLENANVIQNFDYDNELKKLNSILDETFICENNIVNDENDQNDFIVMELKKE